MTDIKVDGTNVQFREDSFYPSAPQPKAQRPSKLARLVMKLLGLKDEGQAKYVLIALSIGMFALSAYWLLTTFVF